MKWLILLSLIAANMVQQPSPVVRTSSGLVRGRVSEDGGYYQYLGIPYGTVNEQNRFQSPLPAPKWEGVLDAIDDTIRCPQIVSSFIIGNSDCLRLNVNTPTGAKPDDLLPVMVYIHGGCFFEGSGSSFIYGADFLVEHSVVFVTINYRLSVEGFLCLGIKEAPGNAGLKDQILALKWIRDNIKAFNGDPDNVTLFGNSAGSVSISLLILAPTARGLFHKAILQSGSSLAPWGLQHDPIETASELVKELGVETNDPHEIYSIISNKTANELLNAIKYDKTRNYITAQTIFVPCVEKVHPNVDSVITEHPSEIIKSGNYTKIPMIIGVTENEGTMFVSLDFGTKISNYNIMDTLKSDLVLSNESERNSIVDRILRHYFSPEKDDEIMNMVDFYSDVHFTYPGAIESGLYSMTNDKPIYYYRFKYDGYLNVKVLCSLRDRKDATHADELCYLFKPHGIPLPHRFLETLMIKRMVTMWTNFAKYGDPTPTTSQLLPVRWRPSRESNPRALVIDQQLTTSTMWDPVAVAFWNDTYKKYRRTSYGFKN